MSNCNPFASKAGGDLVYDDSKSNPWVASKGYLSAESSFSETIEGVLGYNGDRENNWGLVVDVTGKAEIKVTGSIEGEGRRIVAKSKLEVGKLHVIGSVKAQAGENAQWDLYKIDYVMCDGIPVGNPDDYVLHSW